MLMRVSGLIPHSVLGGGFIYYLAKLRQPQLATAVNLLLLGKRPGDRRREDRERVDRGEISGAHRRNLTRADP